MKVPATAAAGPCTGGRRRRRKSEPNQLSLQPCKVLVGGRHPVLCKPCQQVAVVLAARQLRHALPQSSLQVGTRHQPHGTTTDTSTPRTTVATSTSATCSGSTTGSGLGVFEDGASERERGSRPHEPRQLSAREVLRASGQRTRQQHGCAVGEGIVGRHFPGVDLEDLRSPFLVWQLHSKVHLQPPRSEQRLVDEFRTVGQPQHEHVGGLHHSVHLGQELVHHRVPHSRRVSAQTAALPRNRVHLVEDDHVQGGLVPKLRVLGLGGCEQGPDFFLRLPHKLVHDLRAVDDLRLPRTQGLGELPRH
mmetsp:Transcript_82960/g.161557  ORF Transcript_82960/g.161557 Transcript_82960/m.161557 type:complete len:305 (+) Transcript_82960:1093-2007(+)